MAKMTKQPCGKTDIRSARINGEHFHMDYGFFCGPCHLQSQIKCKYGVSMTISLADHKPIIESHEGDVAYLLIVDSKEEKLGCSTKKQKNPPSPLSTSFSKDRWHITLHPN
jgi:hypothetical protein